ncbi:unnamed protein product, partial [Callosobruchus maculatus]
SGHPVVETPAVCPFLFEWTNRNASGRTEGRTYMSFFSGRLNSLNVVLTDRSTGPYTRSGDRTSADHSVRSDRPAG